MNRHLWLGIAVLALSLPAVGRAAPPNVISPAAGHSTAVQGSLESSAALRAMFADPPRQYSSAPLWVWNDMLTEEQVISTLRELAAQKVRQAFVHPRPGLMTPYLSADWFRLWKAALAEAERLDMNLWIYDENSYPSGFAGGLVPDAMPESRGRGLALREVKQPGKLAENVLAVFRMTDQGYEDVTQKARSGEPLKPARYVVASVERARPSPWYGGKCYVDLMYPGVTEKFLEITLGAYQKQIGEQFGKRCPGSFTDEPNIRPAGGLPWTDHLPAEFQKRWGYSLLAHLPSLMRPVGDWKKVRHDYFQVILEQFIEHWGKPYYEYCAKHNLEFTGHYWDHEWPHCVGVPDNMAMSAWQQRPGIDCLMNQYREDTHAQFGNVRMVKELSSVANQLGRKRTLCEIYGAGGWDLRFEDMKRIGDWLEVLGVNMLDEHVSYVTLRGARKCDHPQSFSYHEPWWPAYHVMTRYFTRLSAALSQGEQINRILVIEPTTTAWMYQNASDSPDRLKQIGDTFFDLLMSLERAQVDYDLGCENVMASHSSVVANPAKGTELIVGLRSYHTVVLPPWTETLSAKTVALLETFLRDGGVVISCGPAPALVDGRPSDRGAKLAQSPGWRQVEPAMASDVLLPSWGKDFLAIRRTPGDAGTLFHHRRKLADGELLFLVNTSIESPTSGMIQSNSRGVEQWNLHTGAIGPYPFGKFQHAIECRFSLPPCGSLLLFFSGERKDLVPAPAECKWAAVKPSGAIETCRVEPNVLTIDYMDVTAGGETKKNLYFHKANRFAFQKNGMERNPWDSAVQFKDELITRKFPADSGLEATYRFTIQQSVPQKLAIVIERPDLYKITCNGKPVTPVPGAWWLDKAFGKIDLAGAAKVGENEVTVKASPFTIFHELEPAYLLGEFSLRSTDHGFVVVPGGALSVGPKGWKEQGHPFYAAGVAYRQTFTVAQPAGKYRVSLPKWYGSVARVSVNGKPAGYVFEQPWQCDVTGLLKPGANTIEVLVIGTLKNTLGPHHAAKPVLGTAWPAMFHQGPEIGPPPGADYQTVSYGLFAPFVLEQSR